MIDNSKHYPVGVSSKISISDDKTLIDLFYESVASFQDLPAYESFGETISFNQIDTFSYQFASYLQDSGVKLGDRVALMSPNCLLFIVAMWGILRTGAIQVNVNPLYTAPELKHQLLDSDVETIVIFSGSTTTLSEILNETNIRQVIVFNIDDLLEKSMPSSPVAASLENVVSFRDALQKGAQREFNIVDIKPSDGAFLQYTGGTTGLSKGAHLSHHNLIANVEQFLGFCGDLFSQGNEVILTAIPMYHIFALMVNAISFLSLGARNVLVTNPRDIDSFVALWKSARPTVFTGVNTLYNGLLHHPDFSSTDFSRLNVCIGGGAPVIPTVSASWRETTGVTIFEGYGLSETSPVLTLNLGIDGEFCAGIGLALPNTQISLRDENMNPVNDGDSGELCVKGPQVMSGYWNNPAANTAAFTEDGFFKTGDIAMQDNNGFYHIVDRKKDMVLVSGFNVYPNEIEATVSSMSGVVECACIGVDDDKTGEAIKLFVVKSNISISKESIIEHCRVNLAAYKVPKQVEFIEELPKSTVGKVLRRELR